ncbi:hypothetical protein [Methylomonas sp. MgM2]
MYQKFVIFVLTFSLYGCQSTFGPGALQSTHPAYNQAMTQSLNEEMLLNLVRLRYLDKPFFLKVGSVTAALTLSGSVGIDSSLDLSPGGNIVKPNLGLGYSDKPTISFQPLYGEDFLKSVLSSISFDALLVMTQSGWSIERVFGLCVERINDLFNAPSASGPTPVTEPEFRKFKRAMELIRHLQLAREVEIGPDDNNRLHVMFRITDQNHGQISELSGLLGVASPEGTEQYFRVKLDNNFLHIDAKELKIRPRSIMSILFYLSQQVDIPAQDIESGLVTVTKTGNNNRFNWAETPAGGFFHVRTSNEFPETASLAVRYRDHWFYIADNDLQSKSTFMLLTQLFDLQSGQSEYVGPTLTLPVR